MKSFWNWLKSLFTSDKAKNLLTRIVNIVANKETDESAILEDKEVSDKAIEIATDLENTDLTGTEKAAKFNEIMKEYLVKIGKAVGPILLNLIREIAVYAIKAAIIAALAEGEKMAEQQKKQEEEKK